MMDGEHVHEDTRWHPGRLTPSGATLKLRRMQRHLAERMWYQDTSDLGREGVSAALLQIDIAASAIRIEQMEAKRARP